jgi:integrase/recombinase XerD
MHLIAATEDFKLCNRPKPGFPIVLWGDMSSCWVANEFLRFYLMRGEIESKKSWEPISRAIYDYFGFLEAHELAWDDVNRFEEKNLIAAYRDYCFEVANLSRNTVRLRILYICEFYNFAKRKSWVQSLPYEYEKRHVMRPGGYLAHVDASGGNQAVRSVMPRKHAQLIKFLTAEQAKALLGAADNPHHRLIILLGLQSGLRREELATFPLAYVFDPDAAGVVGRNVRVKLEPSDGTGMKTKRMKARHIYFSKRLMKELHHYAVHWRGERASLSKEPQKPLFLNQSGMPWAQDGKGIEVEVRKIGAKVGLKVHPHMLRHTYATHTLSLMQKAHGDARIEPLVFLQHQLGHASINTTMVYVHIANELADNAVLAYDDELNDWDTVDM